MIKIVLAITDKRYNSICCDFIDSICAENGFSSFIHSIISWTRLAVPDKTAKIMFCLFCVACLLLMYGCIRLPIQNSRYITLIFFSDVGLVFNNCICFFSMEFFRLVNLLFCSIRLKVVIFNAVYLIAV